MFTGIIKDVGSIQRIKKSDKNFSLEIKTNLVGQIDATLGDSISVNGVCLTITNIVDEGFTVDVMKETLRRTEFFQLKVGDKVNLEPAILINQRLDGHFVLGHVDACVRVVERKIAKNSVEFVLERLKELKRYTVEKGSVALDGVSLTISAVTDETFSVSLIPFTLQHTVLGDLQVGSFVNIETDILGKYILGDAINE